MEENFDEKTQERAVLVGLNADCFKADQTATDETLEELNHVRRRVAIATCHHRERGRRLLLGDLRRDRGHGALPVSDA